MEVRKKKYCYEEIEVRRSVYVYVDEHVCTYMHVSEGLECCSPGVVHLVF